MPESSMPQSDLEQLIMQAPVATMQPGRNVPRKAQYGKFFTYLHQKTPLLAGATADRSTVFTVDGNYVAFAVQKITCLADSLQAKVLWVVTPNGEQFMGDPFFLSHLGGGQFPQIIHPAWLLRKNNVVTAVFDDRQLVQANNNIRIAYFGQKVQADPIVGAMRYNAAKQFIYPANFTANDSGQGALLPNQQKTYTAKIDADSDFEIQKITVVSDAPVLIQIQVDADNLFDTDIRSELLGGSLIDPIVPPLDPSGWHPFILPAPRWLMGAAYYKVSVTNTVNAANRCEIQLHGVRLYPNGGIAANIITPGRSS